MADNTFIRYEQAEGIGRITFDRPKHNVFNIEMMREFNALLEDVSRDAALKAVVIAGEGKSWCAGVDVGDHEPETAGKMISAFSKSLERIGGLPMPTIAAVHGACLGGGMEYAIACDIIIASEAAMFGQPEVRLGFFPPYAAVRLPHLVGPARAVEICATGRVYSAGQAQAMGLVSRVVPADQFDDAVETLLKDLKAGSPLILRLNKQAVNDSLGLPPDQALSRANDLFLNKLMKTEDTLEGIASFYKKRKPEWKNK